VNDCRIMSSKKNPPIKNLIQSCVEGYQYDKKM